MISFICELCKEEIEISNLHQKGAHISNCRRKGNSKQKTEYMQNPKNCKFCLKAIEYSKKANQFCSSSCNASFNNKFKKGKTHKFSKKGKRKLIQANKKRKGTQTKERVSIYCKECNNVFLVTKAMLNKRTFCSVSCAHIWRTKNIPRRSKNEVAFFELCRKEFKNVKSNEIIVNGWDADIYFPQFKLAVFWNGVWHYKKILKKQSLIQTQNRDKIKQRIFEEQNIKVYIIKDLGRDSFKKVEREFELFKKYVASMGFEPMLNCL